QFLFASRKADVQFRRDRRKESAATHSQIQSARTDIGRSARMQAVNTLGRWIVVTVLSLVASVAVASEPPTPKFESVRTNSVDSKNVGPRSTEENPEIEKLLRDWERAAADRCRVDARFTRWTYDRVFEVERRSTGRLAVDTNGRADYEITPMDVE